MKNCQKYWVEETVYSGKWNDILVNVNWSHKDDGFYKVWVNNKLVHDFKGKTKSKGVKTYFKFGIYRSKVSTYELMYKPNVSLNIIIKEYLNSSNFFLELDVYKKR